MKSDPKSPPFVPSMRRRTFVNGTMAGTVALILGGSAYVLADDQDERKARATLRPDGRPRLPPNQYLLKHLRPMGGDEGDPSPGGWRCMARSTRRSSSISRACSRCPRSTRRATFTA
ncbi:MAG TPA: hypothetical protein VII82_06300 [Polyangiaceae bacterium]